MSELNLPVGIELVELVHGHDLAVVSVAKQKGGAEEEENMDSAPVAPAAPESDTGEESKE